MRRYRLGAEHTVEAVKRWCSDQCEQIFKDSLEDLSRFPLFIAAMPFDPDRKQRLGSIWTHGPAQEIWLPQTIWLANPEFQGVLSLTEGDVPSGLAPAKPTPHTTILEDVSPPPASAMEREAWRQTMTQLLDTLRDPSSALNKVVLARQTKLDAPAGRTFDVLATVEQLRRSQPSATVFWYSDGEAGSFFGATPELLIEREGESVRTVALAGTCRRGVDADEDQALERNLQSNDKERFEHQLVVEAIQQAFTRLGVEAIHEPAPRVRKLKQVQHLQTDISATGREAGHLLDYVFGLHPTPAVGGVPTTEALPWLRENEAMDRGAYAAPIGWLNADGEGSFYVALRSALVRGEQAWTFAGAGIVADSDADHEWREIEQKMATVTSALRIRSDSE